MWFNLKIVFSQKYPEDNGVKVTKVNSKPVCGWCPFQKEI